MHQSQQESLSKWELEQQYVRLCNPQATSLSSYHSAVSQPWQGHLANSTSLQHAMLQDVARQYASTAEVV